MNLTSPEPTVSEFSHRQFNKRRLFYFLIFIGLFVLFERKTNSDEMTFIVLKVAVLFILISIPSYLKKVKPISFRREGNILSWSHPSQDKSFQISQIDLREVSKFDLIRSEWPKANYKYGTSYGIVCYLRTGQAFYLAKENDSDQLIPLRNWLEQTMGNAPPVDPSPHTITDIEHFILEALMKSGRENWTLSDSRLNRRENREPTLVLVFSLLFVALEWKSIHSLNDFAIYAIFIAIGLALTISKFGTSSTQVMWAHHGFYVKIGSKTELIPMSEVAGLDAHIYQKELVLRVKTAKSEDRHISFFPSPDFENFWDQAFAAACKKTGYSFTGVLGETTHL